MLSVEVSCLVCRQVVRLHCKRLASWKAVFVLVWIGTFLLINVFWEWGCLNSASYRRENKLFCVVGLPLSFILRPAKPPCKFGQLPLLETGEISVLCWASLSWSTLSSTNHSSRRCGACSSTLTAKRGHWTRNSSLNLPFPVLCFRW